MVFLLLVVDFYHTSPFYYTSKGLGRKSRRCLTRRRPHPLTSPISSWRMSTKVQVRSQSKQRIIVPSEII